MTVYVMVAVIATWALFSFLVLLVFTRAVSLADEENELNSMRREIRAADGGLGTPLRS